MSDIEQEGAAKAKMKQENIYLDLKMAKSRAKAAFTRAKNRLTDTLTEDEIDKDLCREQLDKVEQNMDKAIEICHELAKYNVSIKKQSEMDIIMSEVDMMEKQYEELMKLYHQNVSVSIKGTSEDENSIHEEAKDSEKSQIGKDLWKQLKRVSIPVFYGEKIKYPAWKAAFYSCVDSAPSTPEFKLLQLREYLGGEALKCIENLGHSATAYSAAKERLERKFGGTKRIITRFLDELENFTPIKNESPREIERFADLLDIAVINLKEVEHDDDLKDGALYHRLLKKLPQIILTRYNRKVDETGKKESVETLREFINAEAEYAIRANESIHGLSSKVEKVKSKSFFVKNQSNSEQNCKVCRNNQHKVWNCEKFKAMKVQERWKTCKDEGLCFRCLKEKHTGKNCRFKGKCGIGGCSKTHNRLLHEQESVNPLNANASEFQPQVFSANDSACIGLRTVPVIIKVENREVKINALLDDGSTKSFINEDIVAELGLCGKTQLVEVNVINGKTESFDAMTVNFTLQSTDKSMSLQMEAQTTRNVTGKLRPIDWKTCSKQWPHLKGINFPTLGKKAKVDLLIGLDYVELHKSLGEIHSERGTPVARLTPLGWTCVGPIKNEDENQSQSLFTFHANSIMENDTIKQFWDIEKVPEKNNFSKNDNEIIEKTERLIRYDGERYEVPLPFKETKNMLPDNYEMAKSRLISTEKRLERNVEVKKIYTDTIKSYIEKGYVESIDIHGKSVKRWFLPHFPVVKMNRETTKVRIVFDASARYQGTSLNDVTEQGPTLQNSLFDVLLRFRHHRVAICCDIQEMYLRVGIVPSDRPYHCFLWRETSEDDPKVYQFNRLVFGVNASPFLAQFVSQHNARLHQSEFPLASDTVLRSTYMDDSMDSVKDDKTALLLYEQLTDLWGKAGMLARKWISNSKEVLKHIPTENRALKIDITKELPKFKTLGVMWLSDIDSFTFEVNKVENSETMTKREYLKKISTIFDPLGLVAPFTIRAKIMMQEVWISGTDWDEQLDESIRKQIDIWFDELSLVSEIQVPRCLKPENCVKSMTLHTFCDASVSAYGSVVYMCCEHEHCETSVRFVAAKSKVAPITAVSIPRMELMAAVLGMKLTLAITKALDLDIGKCVFWTDSLDVIYWLRNQSRVFKPFVANRVSHIQEHTNPSQWHHVKGEQNPADLVSRGVKIKKLVEESFWWEGPEFLKQDQDEWPKTYIQSKEINTSEMKKRAIDSSFTVTTKKTSTEWRLEPSRYSSWVKLTRIMAWVTRFVENCRVESSDRKCGELSCDELIDSEEKLIRDAQINSFHEYQDIVKGRQLPKSSKLLTLNPQIDSEGILRCNSRLKYAEFMSYNSRFPIILPRDSWVTKLIVRSIHNNGGHCGTNHTLSDLSTKFWVIHAREVIKEVENNCAECKRKKAQPGKQIMAPLPNIRLSMPLRAFAHVAVDYGGPFLTVQGRGKSRQKRYMCLFTCLATRAVHIEISYSMDTNAFLNAFYRMVSRRGLPVKVLSDNGTNFIGGDKELKSLVKSLDQDKITRSAADRGITWQYNPPLAPHWGGVHEIMIKAAKRAVYSVLKGADVTDEELMTAFVGAESLINSRPLTYQSANASDCIPITPNHFLFGQLGGEFASQSVDTTDYSPVKRWRRVQELMRHFWQRWLREWLPSLSPRKRWFHEKRDLQPGDVVLVISPDTVRGKWPLGRIIQIHAGVDGRIRSATIQVGGKEIDRPITKLCPLECDN